jgi:hypothetical protein
LATVIKLVAILTSIANAVAMSMAQQTAQGSGTEDFKIMSPVFKSNAVTRPALRHMTCLAKADGVRGRVSREKEKRRKITLTPTNLWICRGS